MNPHTQFPGPDGPLLPRPVTDLEVRLAEPGGAALRQRLIARMDALADALARALRAGVPRDTYAVQDAALQAVQAASKVLRAHRADSNITHRGTAP